MALLMRGAQLSLQNGRNVASTSPVTGPRMARLAPCRAPVVASRPPARAALNVVAKAAAAGTVKMIIQGRKLPVTEAIRQYVESKISHAAQNFQQTIKEVDVTLSARGGDTGTHGRKQQKVEVTIYTLRNGVVRVEDTEDTLYAAIDKAADKVERKMQKVKEIAITKGKWPGKAGPHVDVEAESYNEYIQEVVFNTKVTEKNAEIERQLAELNAKYPATVLRKKSIALDPMTVEEAIEALEAVGHPFYVFREIETDTVQVLYKREAEGYGIIVPNKRE